MNTATINKSDEILNVFTYFLRGRREKFIHIDQKKGKFKGYFVFILTTFSSIMIIPLLFFLAANILDHYLNIGVNFDSTIWVMLTCISITLFFTPLIGFIYDRIDRLKSGRVVKGLFVLLATIGVIICCGYLFKQASTPDLAYDQFVGTMIALAFLFPMMTVPTIKNAVYFTPSQDERRKLVYWEAAGYLIALFFFSSLPYWIKHGNETCNCDAECQDTESINCGQCYEQCDSFNGTNYFLISLLIMVCIFGLLNIIHCFAVRFRRDEQEIAGSSLNSRIIDFGRNPLLVKTVILVFLEYMVFFLISFWFTYYIFYELKPEYNCHESFHFLCTRGFWFQLTLLVIVAISILITLAIRKYNYVSMIWVWLPIPLILAGAYLMIFCKPQQPGSYFLIIILASLYLGTLPNTKAIFTNAVYYDEYISGNPQANFGSSLYIGAIALAMFFTIALEFSFLNQGFNLQSAYGTTIINNYNDLGTGILLTIFSLAIIIIKCTYNEYELAQFDKIQLAIERNNTENNDDFPVERYAFYDPIELTVIKKVPRPKSMDDKKIFYLVNTLNDSEFIRITKRKFDKITYENYIKNFCLFILLFFCIFFPCYYYQAVNSLEAWAFILCFILAPISFLAMIIYFNSARAAKKLKIYNDNLYDDFFIKYYEWRLKFMKGNPNALKQSIQMKQIITT